jgi:hypothetical protein
MNWKPFARICAACGLSLAVIAGEEREHLHVEEYNSPAHLLSSPIVVVTSAGSFSR